MELERAVGRLEEGFKSVKEDVSEMKDDIKTLLTWRWKLFGATAVISIMGAGFFELFMALVVHAK